MTHWTIYESTFWVTLASQLTTGVSDCERRREALAWMIDMILAPERQDRRQDIVTALEEAILMTLRYIGEQKLPPEVAARYIVTLLIPMLESELIQDIDPTLRRLIGYIYRLSEEGRVTTVHSLVTEAGEELRFTVTEAEEEQAVQEILRSGREEAHEAQLTFGLSSISSSLTRAIPGYEHEVTINIEVPLVCLLLADTSENFEALLGYLIRSLELVDPPLAQRIEALGEQLRDTNALTRLRTRRELCLVYLTSTYYALQRDPAHAMRALYDAPHEIIDGLCALPIDASSFNADLVVHLTLANGTHDIHVPQDVINGLFFLSPIAVPSTFGSAAEEWAKLFRDHTFEDAELALRLGLLCRKVLSSASVFETLHRFFNIFAMAVHNPQFSVLDGDDERISIIEWIQNYILFMLSIGPNTTPQDGEIQFTECTRRLLHADCLRYGIWIAASPRSIENLSQMHQGADAIVTEWLLRGLVLAERFVPIMIAGTTSIHEIALRANRIRSEMNLHINVDTYPDLFNPFLLGPANMDHGLGLFLNILLATWPKLPTPESVPSLPFWWSDEIAEALQGVAERPKTDAEDLWLTAILQGKQNRLNCALLKPVSDIAAELIAKATALSDA